VVSLTSLSNKRKKYIHTTFEYRIHFSEEIYAIQLNCFEVSSMLTHLGQRTMHIGDSSLPHILTNRYAAGVSATAAPGGEGTQPGMEGNQPGGPTMQPAPAPHEMVSSVHLGSGASARAFFHIP
jgi:hypothetical protein